MPGNFHAVPESIIASWPKPNYVDPVRRAWMPEFGGVLLAVSTLLVFGRFYLRARNQAGAFGLDDILIFSGWLFAVGLTVVAFIDAGSYGMDVHTWDVRLQWYTGAALCGWIAQIFFLISTCATKASVLLFYRRMVKDTGDWVYAIWAALAFTACYFVAILLAYCLICQPLNAYWLSYDFHYDRPFTCLNGNVLSPFVGVLSVFSDLYAVILPFAILQQYNLQVPKLQKIGLNIIFALGLLVAGAGIARTYYLWKINHTYDTSWTGFDLYVWSLVECHLAIQCACAPSLRAFLRKYITEPLHRTFHNSSYGRSRSRSRQGEPKNSQGLSPRTWGSDFPPSEQYRRGDEAGQKVLSRPCVEEIEEGRQGSDPTQETTRGVEEPRFRSAEEYESYAMRQLDKHAYKRPTVTETNGLDYPDPRRTHHVGNARSWLDDDDRS